MIREAGEGTSIVEGARLLPEEIRRQLIVVRGRSGLLFEDFDNWLVENQAKFGKGTDDYVAMVQVHDSSKMGPGEKVLGIHEEVSKRCTVVIDGKETEFVEANPQIRNIWVGEYANLLTPEEAANTPYSGRTALDWATQGGKTPEMIIRANNGYFYPATKNDVVMSDKR